MQKYINIERYIEIDIPKYTEIYKDKRSHTQGVIYRDTRSHTQRYTIYIYIYITTLLIRAPDLE